MRAAQNWQLQGVAMAQDMGEGRYAMRGFGRPFLTVLELCGIGTRFEIACRQRRDRA